MRPHRTLTWLGLCAWLGASVACNSEETTPASSASPKAPTPPAPAPKAPAPEVSRAADARTLILSQAQFTYETDAAGKRVPKPGPAKLTLLARDGERWRREVLEDPESRVFHKALCHDFGDGPALVTVGASRAILRSWSHSDGAWKGSAPLYEGRFGGKWDRLRDLEVGDLDGDGRDELVVGTHDQGVIVVLTGSPPALTATVVYEKPDTFIHEVELGDVMGLGRPQIFATPSDPNRANASQDGSILVLAPNAKGTGGFAPALVAKLQGRHAKEILTADLDGDGRDELYAAVEAELTGGAQAAPVEIRRYRFDKRKWKSELVATLERAVQSRVLLAADLTGAGKDLYVTTMKDGVWRLVPQRSGGLRAEQLDATSSGFEHAARALDLDGDGKLELYVAPDDQDELRRYTYDGARFVREVIAPLEKSDITWNLDTCSPGSRPTRP